MTSPDIGRARAAVVLEAGESKEFPFRLNDSGRMRIRLNYWRSSLPNLNCHAPPKDSKLVTSDVFTILPISSQLEESGDTDPLITAADVAALPKTRRVSSQNSCFAIHVRLNGKLVDGPQVITLKTKRNERAASLGAGCFKVPSALLREKTLDVTLRYRETRYTFPLSQRASSQGHGTSTLKT